MLNAVDAKSRVSLPANYRKTIERNTNEAVAVLGLHETDPCLIGYDRAWGDMLLAEIREDRARAKISGAPADRFNPARLAFGLTEDVNIDTTGRITLPAFYREHAAIANWVWFMADGDTFEMWNPQVLLAHPDMDPRVKAAVRHDLAKAGVPHA